MLLDRFDEVHEEGMRMEDGGGVFGMELGTDKPLLVGDFHHFHEVVVGIASNTLHTVTFERFKVLIVELVTMAMTLLDMKTLSPLPLYGESLAIARIGLCSTATFDEFAIVGTEAHRTTHTLDGLLFFHQVDDWMLGVGIHLRAVRILISEHIAGELDDHRLHTQTDAEGRDVVGTGVLDGCNLAFDASLSEAWTDDDASHAVEFR